jgi:hypothetical protein
VVAYVKNDDIYVRRFSASGSQLNGEILISTFEQEKVQFEPDIDIANFIDDDTTGTYFTVAWTHESEEDDFDIRASIYDLDGNIYEDFPIANTSQNESEPSISLQPNIDFSNTIDYLDIGGISFTFQNNQDTDILLQELISIPSLVINPTNINVIPEDNRSQNQTESSLVVDADGNFIISWTHEYDNDNDDDGYFRRFSPNGNPLDTSEIIVDSASDNQNNSQIALGNDGTIVVAYEDENDNSIKYRQFNSEGDAISDSENYDINSDFEQNPALAIGANNTMVITADDNATHDFDPYARIYESELNTPLNRFQNRNAPGTYLFATEGESVSIRTNYPNFVEEGIAFYAYNADAQIASDFYRFQNSSQLGTYLFVGETERQTILQNFPNFIEEGIAFEAAF